jgi:hypothetical protein
MYLLTACPTCLVAKLGMAWPMFLVLALFFTHCSEILRAAAGDSQTVLLIRHLQKG